MHLLPKDMKEKGFWKGGQLGVVGIEGGYHGDTMGAMDAAGPNVYNEEINWYVQRRKEAENICR